MLKVTNEPCKSAIKRKEKNLENDFKSMGAVE